jgi:MFS transporter, YNFM family, putative membrane transport protein
LFASSLFLGQAAGVSLNALVIDHAGYMPAFLLPALGLPLIGVVFAALIGRRQRAV